MTSLYDFFSFEPRQSRNSTKCLSWKVLLVINTATGCGLTPQYQALQELYDRYQDQGFEILDFLAISLWDKPPAAQRKSTPSVAYTIKPLSPRFAKIKVNGKEADPSMFG